MVRHGLMMTRDSLGSVNARFSVSGLVFYQKNRGCTAVKTSHPGEWGVNISSQKVAQFA